MADDSDEGALYVQWRFDAPVPAGLESTLQPLREDARQAGVELSVESTGNDWLVKMIGLHEPMPAVLEALAQRLNLPPEAASAPTPMIAIRALLKALPTCCTTGTVDSPRATCILGHCTLARPGTGAARRV